MRRLLPLLGVWLLSCASYTPFVTPGPPPADGSQPAPGSTVPGTTPAGAAGAAVAEGVAAAGISRANGGCVATCVHGMICNRKTGLCDNEPCGGTCQSWEVCRTEHEGDAPRCEAAVVPDKKP